MKKIKALSLVLSAAVSFGTVLTVPLTVSAAAGSSVEVSWDDINSQFTADFYSSRGATLQDMADIIYSWRNETVGNKSSVLRLHGVFNEDKTIVLRGASFTIDASDAEINSTADLLFDSWEDCNYYFKGGTWNISDEKRFIKLSNSTSQNVFDGLTVNGGGNTKFGAVFLYGCVSPVIKNCSFNNSSGQAVYIHHCPGAVIADNKFSKTKGHAICLYGGKKNEGSDVEVNTVGCSVVGNFISDAGGDGIKCVKYSSENDKNTVITGNNVWNIKRNNDYDYDAVRGESRSGVGIMIMECKNAIIGKALNYDGRTYIGNSVKNTENYGMVINLSEDTYVEQTYLTDIGTNGIHNSASCGTKIRECGLTNCKEIGIFFTPGPDPYVSMDKQQSLNSEIVGAKVIKCGSYGIVLSKTVKTKVENNLVTNCKDYGIYCVGAKNIDLTSNMVGGTKRTGGSGVNFNEECSGIRIYSPINISLTLDKTSMSLGYGETAVIKASVLPATLDDKTVSWRTSNSKIISVNNKGNVTAKGLGTAWVTASLSNGIETSCRITVKNAPTKITLTKGILTIGVGEKYSVGSGINDGSACAKRTYRTSNSSIVRMTRTDWLGDFVGVKPGVAYVTVRTYNGKESTCKVTVKAAPRSVAVSKKSMTLKVGQSATLSSSIPSDAGCAERIFRTSSGTILKMTKTAWTGQFTALKPGIAYVTVRTYNGKEASCKVTVVK